MKYYKYYRELAHLGSCIDGLVEGHTYTEDDCISLRTVAGNDLSTITIKDYIEIVPTQRYFKEVPNPFQEAFDELIANGKVDMVNEPPHYKNDKSGVECIEITRHRNFNIGNAIKYLWRSGLKQDSDKSIKAKEIEDLKKAIFYINDEIKRIENG